MSFTKRIITGVFFSALLTSNAYAAGLYDGIWEMHYGTTFIGYNSIHQNGNQIVAIPLLNSEFHWEALLGTLNDNTVTVNTLLSRGLVSSSHSVVFSSLRSFTSTQNSCTPAPGYNCTFPDGAVITGTKIW
jgi:hypothetical protein